MKYTYSIIILFSLNMVFSLKGNNGSICYEHIRRVRVIDNKERGDWVPNKFCCHGYKENDSKTCEAQCDQSCVYGKCEKPNECKCDEDYTGVSCEKRLCPAGYKGSKCDEKCSEGTFGRNCEKKCACQNKRCDPVNGYCNCDGGWIGDMFTGENCEEKCEEGFWGKDCTQNCDCPKNKCNPINGTCDIICKNGVYINDSCVCNNGWIGELCTDLLCPKGFYGDNCENICLCKEETSQMRQNDTGECICTPGWTGKKCEELCPLNTFGQNCSYACECILDNYDICDPVFGECNCKSNWTVKSCLDKLKCKHGICDILGKCVCDSGWEGELCNIKCSDGFYGPGCNDICYLTGLGNHLCDHVMGPICKAGFSMESNCTLPCEKGTYGVGCKKCSCENSISCNKDTGACECLPGWFGTKCESQCPDSFYGTNCKKKCACKNCRHTDGYCKCQEGWNGLHCRDYCPENFFDTIINQCIDDIDDSDTSVSMQSILLAGIVVVGIVSCFRISIICVCRKKKEHKPYIDYHRASSKTYNDERQSNIYEEIKYEPVQYNTLIHIPVEDGYLEPRNTNKEYKNAKSHHSIYNTNSVRH